MVKIVIFGDLITIKVPGGNHGANRWLSPGHQLGMHCRERRIPGAQTPRWGCIAIPKGWPECAPTMPGKLGGKYVRPLGTVYSKKLLQNSVPV